MSWNLHHCCHRARESSPSVSLAPKWLFLSHLSYISSQIRNMIHMAKCTIFLTHPRTFRLPMDLKLQEEDAMWHKMYSLCGPHRLHVSPCSIATSIFSCIYLICSIIKYLFHSNIWTSFISSLIKIPNLSIQPRELVWLVELSCYATIWMGTLQLLFLHFQNVIKYSSPTFLN